jgi:ATP-binding cassette subfamily B protein
MREFLPVLILGAIIGVFTILFLVAYALEKNKKETMGFDRHMKDGEIVKRLMKYAKPYYKQFVLVFVIMLFSIVYDLVSPLIVGELVQMVQSEFELNQLYLMVGTYACILVVSMICTFLQAMILQKIGQKILSSMRMDVFTHIEKL